MQLRKYYLDLVTPSGEAFAWHWAMLRWPYGRRGWLALRYAAELAWRDGRAEHRHAADAGAEPYAVQSASDGGATEPWGRGGAASSSGAATGESLRWCCAALEIEGDWSSLSRQERILDLHPKRPGTILWTLLHEGASVSVRRQGEVLQGRGYAERLDLSFPSWRPWRWKLPIDVLRWGRLITESRHVVWIAWGGPFPLKRMVVDGALLPEEHVQRIEDDGVGWRGGRITLDRGALLRDARLKDSLQASLRGPARLLGSALPRHLIHARESRWLSSGTISEDDQGGCRDGGAPGQLGWAMHERVIFGAP